MALSKQQVEQLIRQTAQENGAGDIANLLVATAIQETGLDISRPGDNGKSWGAFQEHDAGRGNGIPKESRLDVAASTKRAIAEFRVMQKRYPNADPGTIAVMAQRPRADLRPGYIANVNASVQRMAAGQPAAGGTNGARKPAGPGGIPQAILLSDNGTPITPTGSGTNLRPPVTGGGSGWPLPGGKVTNKFGGPQGRSPGMKGSLPSTNVGVDIAGPPEGSPVVAPVSGEVLKVYQSQGTGNADENGGWGGMVLIKGADGYFHRLSHLQGGSVGVKPGDQVRAGQGVGKVGATGNTSGGGKGPFVHVDWEKFRTKSGNPDDRDNMSFTDPTRAGTEAGGTAVGDSAGRGTRTVTRPAPPPVDETKKREAVEAAIAKDTLIKDYTKRQETIEAGVKDLKDELAKVDAFIEANPAGPGGKNPFPPKQPIKGAEPLSPLIPGGWQFEPGGPRYSALNVEDNPQYKEWNRANLRRGELRQTGDRASSDAKKLAAAQKDVDEVQKLLDSRRNEVTDDAGNEFIAEWNRTHPQPTQADIDAGKLDRDPESGILYDPITGEPVSQLPRDAKPGTTFNVPGKGTYIVNADGKGATLLVPDTKGDWKDAGDQLVQVDANGNPTGVSIPKGSLTGPTVLGGTTGKKLTLWDPKTQSIRTIPNEGYEEKPPSAVTAPRDAEFIVRQDTDGKLIVEKNPNYDTTTGSVTGTSSTGRVYRVGTDGKATITDVLTADERAQYERGKLADTTKVETETQTALLDAATKLMDAELKQRQQAIWGEVQKVIADPNATSDQIVGAIQAGAKDATEWTNILRAHVEQRTNEETARHNKVTEGVSVQEADRALREGLYKDITDTRNQRQLAQGRSNEAVRDSGIIGMANSANLLSSMAPQIGTEGIKKIGTQGLGVGAGAIDPVVKSWEEHQAELQKLQNQMPSIRMADPNVKGPSFAMPRGDASKLNVPPPGNQKEIADLITSVKTKLAGANQPAAAPAPANAPPVDLATAHPVPIQGPEPAPAGPVGAPMGLPDQPAPAIFPPTGPVVPGGSPVPEKEKEGIGLGGGYKGYGENGKIRFRVPQPRKKKVAA